MENIELSKPEVEVINAALAAYIVANVNSPDPRVRENVTIARQALEKMVY